jgi:hypothetical protein
MYKISFSEVLSGYQPGKISTALRTRTEMVFETLVPTKLNHLTRQIARENVIILSRRESIKSYKISFVEPFLRTSLNFDLRLI